jgi:hypothetical protein
MVVVLWSVQRGRIENHLGLGYVNHMKKSTKSRLTEKQIAVFPGNSLFDKIARAVCRAGTLPGKELFEAWEVARRVRRRFPDKFVSIKG